MKIGFIAMSGLRACDPELLEMGLTLPGFVDRGRTIAQLPSLGLLTLAGMTPERHRVRYLEVPDAGAIERLPTDFDLVAISSFSAQIGEAYRVAGRYRDLGVPVVMGGLHVTTRPQEALEHGAIPVAGEGELVWPRILDDAEARTLAPMYDARVAPGAVTSARARSCSPTSTSRSPSTGCSRRSIASARSRPVRLSSSPTTTRSSTSATGADCCPSSNASA
jgi:radical SAM superfamily enzyme YgiQ (UPF0313 family)